MTFIVLLTCTGLASAASADTNLIANPGFESGATVPLNWTLVTQNGNTPIWDGVVSHSGSKSIKISNPTSIISGFPTSDLIKAGPLQNYTFSAWGKTENVLYNAHSVRIVELDINKNQLLQKNLYFNIGTNDWIQKQMDFQTGSNAAYLYVYANIYNSAGTFWIDDIRLTINPPSNLVTNPSFEIGTAVPLNWTMVTRNGNTPMWDSVISHSGSKSIKISNPTSIISGYPKSDLIKVGSLQKYTFSAWGKTQNVLNNAHAVRIVELDINKNQLRQGNLDFDKGTNDWTQKQMEFQTGSNTAYLYVYANIYYSAGTFWIDDIRLTLNPPSDLVKNPSFESGVTAPMNWILVTQNNNTPIWDSVVSHNGSKSIKISISGTTNIKSGYPKSDLITAEPNHQYYFSAWGKTENAEGVKPAVRVVQLDANKNWLTQTNLIFSEGTNDWTQKKIYFQTGSDTAYLYVYANIWGGKGIFWVDDVKLSLDALLIFIGDFETWNINQWDYSKCTNYASNPSYPLASFPRTQILTNGSRQGNYYASMTAYPGDNCYSDSHRDRIGVHKTGIASASTSPDLYFAFSHKFPLDFADVPTGGEYISIQSTATNGENQYNYAGFKLMYEWNGSAGYVNLIRNEGAGFSAGNTYHNIGLNPYKKGVWHDFIYRIKWARNNTGIVQLWHRLEGETSFTKVYENLSTRTDWSPYTDATNESIYIQETLYRGYDVYIPQTVYFDGNMVGTTLNDVLYTPNKKTPAPEITTWSNSIKNDNQTEIEININETVTLSAIANQTITTWTWLNSGVPSGNNTDSYSVSFSSEGNKTVSVNATNVNGTSNTINWSIYVTPASQIYPKIGKGGVAFNTLNSNFSHTVVNKGDGKVTIGLFADNCDDGTGDWTGGWTCENGVLTPSSTSTRTTTQQNVTEYTNVTLFAEVNESSFNIWNMNLRFLKSRDGIWEGYYYVRNNTGSGLIFERYNNSVWQKVANTSFVRTSTQYYIFDVQGNVLNGYISNTSFAEAKLSQVLTYTDALNMWTNGDYFTFSGTNATFDDIRLIESGRYSGSLIINFDAGANNQSNGIIINATTPAGTNYTVSYREKNTGQWVTIGSGYTGNQTLSISGTKYQDTEINITLFGNGTSFPDIETVEFRKKQVSANSIYDIDENGIVDSSDLILINQHFNEVVSVPYPRYDVNMDGFVNIYDITITGQHFGENT